MSELPAELLAAVERVARRTLGPVGFDEQGLAEAVSDMSERYTRRRDELGGSADTRSLAARLRFFLPRDMPKVAGPLAELERAGALPEGRAWRVLDLGAGVGATSLGLAAYTIRLGCVDTLRVTAVEQDARALRIAQALVAEARGPGLTPIELDARPHDLRNAIGDLAEGPRFDLVLLGLVLNELHLAGEGIEALAELLERACRLLAPGGSVIVLEPALRMTSRTLMAVRDALAARAMCTIFAPCLRTGPCPMLEGERHWCHEEMRAALPLSLQPLAKRAGLRVDRPTYSYLTLRMDGRRVRDVTDAADGQPYRVVSAPLPSKGKLELYGCGDAGLVCLARLKRDRSAANTALEGASRGTLLCVDAAAPVKGRLRLGAEASVRVPSGRGTNA